jgi:hypothetical protein
MSKDGHFTDGHGIRIVFVNQGIMVYEKNVTTSGSDGGDPIDITTNDNVAERSFAPPTLKKPTPTSSEITYNLADLDALKAAVDQSDSIRTEWPDDTTEAKIGWLRSIIPNQAAADEQPTAAIVIEYEGEAPV